MALSAEPKLEQVKRARARISVGFKEIANSQGTYGARAYRSIGLDNSFKLDAFRRSFTARVLSEEDDILVFEMWGVDAPIANAIRRILLAEVPTVAIETVYVHDNSSIVPDEMLSHRLGLVPLLVDPRKLTMRSSKNEALSSRNCIKFSLKARCDKNPSAPRDGIAPPESLYVGSRVLSGSIEYLSYPGTDQIAELELEQVPKPVFDDIVIAKMRPGQKIHVELDAVKGVGKDHAKFSPVATASYRMLPEVRLKQPVTGSRSRQLVDLCPMNVFDIEDGGAVTVARPRDCTMCRECIREPEWNDYVELTRRRDHFIYSVESTGALPARVLVTEALSILIDKGKSVRKALLEIVQARNHLPSEREAGVRETKLPDENDGMEVDAESSANH